MCNSCVLADGGNNTRRLYHLLDSVLGDIVSVRGVLASIGDGKLYLSISQVLDYSGLENDFERFLLFKFAMFDIFFLRYELF